MLKPSQLRRNSISCASIGGRAFLLVKYKFLDKKNIKNSFKNLLQERLAQKISDEYHFEDSEGKMIKDEIKEIVKEEAKSIIKDLVENYFEMKPIKDMIEEEIKNFTKNEIIELLNYHLTPHKEK